MSGRFLVCGLVIGLLVGPVAEPGRVLGQAVDLRRAVPDEVHLALYVRRNPERDYQREYWRQVWQTACQLRIPERVMEIFSARLAGEDAKRVETVMADLREAVKPLDVEAVLNSEEMVYAQAMELPVTQQLVAWRLGGEAAAGLEQAVQNLFGLAEKYSEWKLRVESITELGATMTVLALPETEVPFRPTVARAEGVVILSSSEKLARRFLELLAGGQGRSKFDDPRLKAALSTLPEPEDLLVFHDAKYHFDQLRKLGDFIRHRSRNDPEVERAGNFVKWIADQCAVVDYQVSVGYTEGNQNRLVMYQKLLPDAKEKLLGKILLTGRPMEHWETWVPAEAVSYWLGSGINLGAVYEGVKEFVAVRFPELAPGVAKFEQWQKEHDFDLAADILEAFPGPFVLVSLPAQSQPGTLGQAGVIALECRNPDGIRELLHRAVDSLRALPAMDAQQLKLEACPGMEGFEELSAVALAPFQLRPVIGFRDGWMFVASDAASAQLVLETRAKRHENILGSQSFQRFNLEVSGPIISLRCADLAGTTRRVAQLLTRAAVVGSPIVAMAGAEADPEHVRTLQQLLGLLPDVARVVEKLDFYQAKLSVVQPTDDPLTRIYRSVTLVRPAPDR